MNNEIKVKIKGGYLRAIPSDDPDYPGIWVEAIIDNEDEESLSRPQVLVEQVCLDPRDESMTRVLVWNDKNSEDYTNEIIFKDINK